MTPDSVNSVFVYGTLKTGQCREQCWPRRPRDVRAAWTLGRLYDTGPYPAMLPGEDKVGGQVWTFEPEDMEAVLQALDAVEEYRPGHEATNLYNRQVIECYDQEALGWTAYTYFYAREQDRSQFVRVMPNYSWETLRLALWPEGADW